MKVPRIFIPRQLNVSSAFRLDDAALIHKLKDVLRLAIGAELCVFDGKGREYRCRIQSAEKKRMYLFVEAEEHNEATPSKTVHIGLPVIKEGRMETAIEKATELGVDAIKIFCAERSFKKEISPMRLERFRKIAAEASRQSERNVVPGIILQGRLKEFVAGSAGYDLRIFLECRNPGEEEVRGLDIKKADAILLIVGPEGDFTEAEKVLLRKNDFRPLHLPLPILRTETAALFGVGLMKYLSSKEIRDA